MKNLGIGTQESIKVIQALSGNLDLLKQSQTLATVEFQKGTSIQEEYAIKEGTLAASVAKTAKYFDGLVISIGMSVQAYLPLLSFTSMAAMTFANLMPLISGLGLAFTTVLIPALTMLWGALSTTIGFLWSLAAAFFATPIGWIVGGLALIVGGFVLAYNKVEWFRNTVGEAFQAANNIIKKAYDYLKPYIDAFGDLYDYVIGVSGKAGELSAKNSGTFLSDKIAEGIGIGQEAIKKMPGLVDQFEKATGVKIKDSKKVTESVKEPKGQAFNTAILEDDKKKKDAKASKALENVSGGGSRPINIQIQIDKLNDGGINITTNNLPTALGETEAMVREMLLRIVNSGLQIGVG